MNCHFSNEEKISFHFLLCKITDRLAWDEIKFCRTGSLPLSLFLVHKHTHSLSLARSTHTLSLSSSLWSLQTSLPKRGDETEDLSLSLSRRCLSLTNTRKKLFPELLRACLSLFVEWKVRSFSRSVRFFVLLCPDLASAAAAWYPMQKWRTMLCHDK